MESEGDTIVQSLPGAKVECTTVHDSKVFSRNVIAYASRPFYQELLPDTCQGSVSSSSKELVL
jgi:hypothetical protein